MWKSPQFNGLPKGSLTSTPAIPNFNSWRKRFIKQLWKLQRKGLQGIFNMVQVNLDMCDLYKTSQVIQLGIDTYKACSIIGCGIVYVIFFIIVIS